MGDLVKELGSVCEAGKSFSTELVRQALDELILFVAREAKKIADRYGRSTLGEVLPKP